MFCTNLLTGPQPSRDDWCKNCPPEIAEQVSSPGGLLAGIFLHLLELLEEERSDLNVHRQDSTPNLFSVILNTASLILQTPQPGFIDFLFDLQLPTTFDDYCPPFSPLVGERRSQEQLISSQVPRPTC